MDITTEDGVADAYLVRPEGDGPFPGVLLFPDAFSLRPRIYEMADRIAGRGYAVLAPNLLYRGGRAPLVDMAAAGTPEGRDAVFGKVMPLVLGLDTDKITRDARAYLDFLAAQDAVADGPVVATGYCMGGTNAVKAMAAHPDRIKGVTSFHGGRLVTDQPDSPHLRVGAVTGELYFAHADQDHSMNAEHIATLEAALDAAGVKYTSEVYEGAPHGFTMTDTAAYQEAGEKRHWVKLFDFLDRVHPAVS
ncbi:carboxymethylenebutenolidase [Pseudosporangium ferrugineum]|uniref:Carboxymethylenebutenolidase n=1 Tax=Pseudosporangium ferrugineum TaxID=439699 RepID=A0A2T0S6G9_9ACTN|nr:carboxymethylenebutenolidase [Pseudosporangium ferrugineum]